MTDEATPRQERPDLPPLHEEGETYMIIDRTRKKEYSKQVDGTLKQAITAAEERSAALRGDREVFIFQKVAVIKNTPTAVLLNEPPEVDHD